MKKILLFSFFIFSFSLSKAQWVTIPDANFVAWLQTNYPSCMNGNLMDTTCSGIVNETGIGCWGQNISDLTGIQYFDSLITLECNGNSITNLSTLPNSLINLNCSSNSLTNLPLLPDSLIYLDCRINSLTSLPSLPNSITYLYCHVNALTSLPTLPISLIELRCEVNSLTSLPLLPNTLTGITCSNNLLTSLPSLPDSLFQLICSNNSLTSLPNLPNSLTNLYCNNNSLTSLPSLPVSLHNLICSNNSLTSLPAFPGTLSTLKINNNPGILCMPPLQNFNGGAGSFDISNTGISCLPIFIQHTGYIAQIDTLPICDLFNPNGCGFYWNIKGEIDLDGDGNCGTTIDSSDVAMIKMNLYDSGGTLLQQIIANSGGAYAFNTQLGDYSTSVDTVYIPFNVLCPTNNSIPSNLTLIDSMDWNVDFRLVCKPGFDIGVWNIYRENNFFPGNTTSVHVIAGDVTQSIYNVNCSSGISGEVKVVINGLANYVSPLAGALTPTLNGDTLIYTIADFSLVNANTDFAFNVITDTTAQSGNQICFDVTVTPTAGDNNISNNTLTHCFAVSNSYDPNEKEVSPVGSLTYSYNDWLTYTIHFQNTGNAAAQHIQILDTLDSDLDASTFQLLSYSHAPMVQLFGSKVHFNFVNINLPDSTSDFEGSKGYVSYRIKPLANLPLGTAIENTASIYFDFNTPVITNTVSNLICNPIAPTNLSETICAGDSYNFIGTNISTAGNYSVTLNAVNGCDSVVNLNLTVETINTTIQQTSDTLSITSNGTIQWFDCNSQQIISGANGNIFIPTASGIYSAIITEGNCVDTTACVIVSGFGLVVSGFGFSVFPNPTDENITVTLSHPDSYRDENCKIEISNTLGQIIYKQQINSQLSIINCKLLPAGIYFVTLRSDKMSVIKKLVKD